MIRSVWAADGAFEDLDILLARLYTCVQGFCDAFDGCYDVFAHPGVEPLIGRLPESLDVLEYLLFLRLLFAGY